MAHLIFLTVMSLLSIVNGKTKTPVRIGVILGMDSSFGKMTKTSISMAIDDFYQKHNDSTTVIHPHFRDSKRDNVESASAAIDLLKNVQVMAILGPTTSSQADFIIDIGKKAKVPIISPATSPALSPYDNHYFIRTAQNSSFQLKPIADLIKYFRWREVVFIYEDSEYGRDLVPYLSDAMLEIDAKIMYHGVIYPLASDEWLLKELYKLKTMQTRVFLVHVLPDLALRFFKKVKEAGMMDEGYSWIITDVLTSRLHSLHLDMESMHGVLGVKPYIPRTNELIEFETRWKQEFQRRNPKEDAVTELDVFGIWSYDTIFALAMALEKVGSDTNTTFNRKRESITDLDAIGTLETGENLLSRFRNLRFKGLSGDFHVVNGQLQSPVYQVVNIIGKSEKPVGFWTPKNGLSKKLNLITTNQTEDLGAIIWPGDSHVIPKGWEMPTSNKDKMRVGVPAKGGFVQFVDATTDPQTQQVVVTGFCVDVFNAVMDKLPYGVKHELIPFVTLDGKRAAGSYNDLLHNLSAGKYDAVAGDITIRADRSNYVDFTLPYTEAGVSLIVLNKDERKSPWIFMRPLEIELWITTGAFFIYTGLVVWVLEHRVNKDFRGPAHQQVGMIFWFSFSTLVFAHREKLISNLSRFVVIVWVFVVLVLTSSYTASLASMLTVQQLRPTYTNIEEIRRNGESIGYQDGTFVLDMLIDMGFNESKLKSYSTFEEYHDALQNGSQKGGVSAIMDELPYINVFLAKYCKKYTMTGPTYKSAGFAFAFQKGSPLVQDVSRAVLQVTEEQMMNITSHWFGDAASCDQQNGAEVASDRLKLDSFKGLFIIAGSSSTAALLLFLFRFLHENREMLVSEGSAMQKLAAIAKTFDVFKNDDELRKISLEAPVEELGSPEIRVFHEEAEVFSHDEGFSTTEPGTPARDTTQVVATTI